VIHGLDEAERLTVGRAFTLRSSKWNTYEIGISESINPEYGARMVGLYQTSKTKKMFQSKKSKTWLQPVLLKAQAPRDDGLSTSGAVSAYGNDEESQATAMGMTLGGTRSLSPPRTDRVEEEEKIEGLDPFVDNAISVTADDVENQLEVEVPAWIEMMHRRKKKPQLAYLLRVHFRHRNDVRWIALRTGLDLAPIMQMRRDRQSDASSAVSSNKSCVDSADRICKGTDERTSFKQEKEDFSSTYRLHKSTRRSRAGYPPGRRPLQHQNPADQSARLLSQLLSDITAINATPPEPPEGPSHPAPPSCKTALYSLLKRRNYLDVWFLTGVASDINVTVPARPAPLMQSMIARGLWQSHWREEWMVLYGTHISFFPSGSKKAGWFLCLNDITQVRAVDKAKAPFAGKAFLAIETLGRIHYLCFPNEGTRDAWSIQLNR